MRAGKEAPEAAPFHPSGAAKLTLPSPAMLALEGYSQFEVVHRGPRSAVLRGRRTSDGTRVMIKTPRAEFPGAPELRRLRHEFELGHAIARGPAEACVVRHLALEPAGPSLALILEDFGARSLVSQVGAGGLPLARFLDLAVALADVVRALHEASLVHLALCPANVLYNADSGALRLCDLSACARLDGVSIEGPLLRGGPAYAAPEQTERTGWTVDSRADLYSLGVTLFELLTGRIPFEGGDALELIHRHLAAAPPSVRALRAEVPAGLTSVLARLLRKNPDERYATASGLHADLVRCRDDLARTGSIATFELGAEDRAGRLAPAPRLYGREREMALLERSLARAASGENVLVLVSGEPGVGKSALVDRLRERVHALSGHYCDGKFEALRSNVPYWAFSNALRSFLRAVLARPETELARWRDRVASALGPNGQLFARLVPDLEALIGPQPEAPALEMEQAQARFRHSLFRLVETVAGPEHPLLIFLDDLQWADQASLWLIEQLATADRLGHLLIVGAYRGSEIARGHPLSALLSRLAGARPPAEIALTELDPTHVEGIVADSLGLSADACRPLAQVVWHKARGNPFFVGQFLRHLVSERLLAFDAANGGWLWDLEGCAAQRVTDNVGDLMASRIHRLSASARQALCHASCIGAEFDVPVLAGVLEMTEAELQAALDEATGEQLVAPASAGTERTRTARYRFLHDHVQQAAYASIPAAARPALHLALGRLLVRLYSPEQRHERLFQLTDQLGRGLELVSDPAEQREIAEICLSAGRRAKGENAYGAAVRYLRSGMDLLGADAWELSYELRLALELEHAESSYLLGDHAEMENGCAAIVLHAKNVVDRVLAHQLRFSAHVARYEMPSAIGVALEALRLLGVDLPANPSRARVALSVARSALRLRGETPASLLARPRLRDPAKLAASQILATLSTAAYLTSPNLFPLVIGELVAIALEHGNSAWAADGYLGWGAIEIAAFGRLERGHAIGSVAPRLIEQLGAAARRCKVETSYQLLIRHWLEPLRSTVEPLCRAVNDGVEHGDLAHASAAAVTAVFYAFAAGRPLAEVSELARSQEGLLSRLGQDRFRRDARRMLQLLACLEGRAPEPQRLAGEFFDEGEALQAGLQAGDGAAIASLSYERAFLLYVYRDDEAALECCRLSARHVESVLGTVYPPALEFLSSLVRLRLLTSGARVSRRKELREVKRSLQRLERWSQGAPENQGHRVHLVRAELARLSLQQNLASQEYERAIALAERSGFLHEQAMALECAGRFHLALRQERIAASTLRAARAAWAAWGAAGKVAALEAEFAALGAGLSPVERALASFVGVADDRAGALDAASIIKASQAIVGEIRLPDLVRRLLAIAMENSGAQRGVLLLRHDGELRVEARADLDSTANRNVGALGSLAEAGELLPISVVESVARTARPVLSADLGEEPRFSHDPYVLTKHPRSVLCAPFVSQGEVNGVVYLENRRMRGAFTPERRELLSLLSSIAAISLQNARLYEDLTRAHTLQLRVSEAQSRFVPSEFLRSLDRESIVDVALGDNTRKEMSILFSDMRGFTPLLETMSPQRHIGFINEYLGRMEPAIVENGGFVDSYVGDAILALFESESDKALAAAVGMSAELARFNQERSRGGASPIAMGVGINTGLLTLGTIGGPTRLKCGVIGDPVNVAARVEALTKHFGCFLLVSHFTRDQLKEPERFELRLVDCVRVKGKTTPIRLYEALAAEPDPRREGKLRTLGSFEEAMDHYLAGRFREAERLFRLCLTLCPNDGAAALLAARCLHHDSEPPPAWEGVHTLTEK
ncbi:MAG TPA: AAA family ATPase [Polyangiaceae bacterium]